MPSEDTSEPHGLETTEVARRQRDEKRCAERIQRDSVPVLKTESFVPVIAESCRCEGFRPNEHKIHQSKILNRDL